MVFSALRAFPSARRPTLKRNVATSDEASAHRAATFSYAGATKKLVEKLCSETAFVDARSALRELDHAPSSTLPPNPSALFDRRAQHLPAPGRRTTLSHTMQPSTLRMPEEKKFLWAPALWGPRDPVRPKARPTGIFGPR